MESTGREICPGCGAAYRQGRDCQVIFDEFLVLEFTDPDYGAVHFLTVACYMIQHGHYSPAGLAWIAARLREVLEGVKTPDQVRLEAAKETGQDRRDWKVTRRPGDPPQPPTAWSITIQDVDGTFEDTASYSERIRAWARATLAEMEPLLSRGDPPGG
jgi:hypothetical protein